jgi:hypothetical protein
MIKSWRTSLLYILCLPLFLGGCHLDGLFISGVHDNPNFRPPSAPETTIAAQFSGISPFDMSGGEVSLFLSEGTAIQGMTTSIDNEGGFTFQIKGTQSYSNLIVHGRSGALTLMALFPEIPSATQVYDYPQLLVLSDQLPPMHPIDHVATTLTLLIAAKSIQSASGLSALTTATIEDTSAELLTLMTAESPVATYFQMVIRLLTHASSLSDTENGPFLSPELGQLSVGNLNPEFLLQHPLDYDGDGVEDVDNTTYVSALNDALAAFDMDICYDPELISVVFQVDLNEGLFDLNCNTIDFTRWVVPDQNDRVFITGAVHEDMLRCEDVDEDNSATDCATPDEVVLVNEALGNFVPNQIELFDDGTHGDHISGDNIYSRSFILSRGVQIAYKYTYGQSGEGWTGTEEWPGNSRILELIDVNGDEIIVRRDIFGDESTNKDKANSLAPGFGGRGTVTWDTDANGDGLLDTREVTVDLDGDCQMDDFPPVGPNVPIRLDCQ